MGTADKGPWKGSGEGGGMVYPRIEGVGVGRWCTRTEGVGRGAQGFGSGYRSDY